MGSSKEVDILLRSSINLGRGCLASSASAETNISLVHSLAPELYKASMYAMSSSIEEVSTGLLRLSASVWRSSRVNANVSA